MEKTIYIIDGNSLLFRAFYATSFGDTSNIMRTSSGIPTNAIFAFANMMSKILSSFKGGESLFVAFDADSRTFRKEEYDQYKANRKPCPPELATQFPISREFLDALGILHYEEHGIEADDIAGTLSHLASKEGYKVKIFTSDKDYLQLIDENVEIHLIKTGLSNVNIVTKDNMVEQFGFTPAQIVDYKGLRGDSSDNLPGIPGIGDKTAVKLLQEYGDLETIFLSAKKGEIKGKVGESLIANEEMGRMCYRLAQIKKDCPLPFSLPQTEYEGYAFSLINAFAQKYEMKQLVSRLPLGLKKESQMELPAIERVSSMEGKEIPNEIGLALDLDGDSYWQGEDLGLAFATSKAIYYLDKESLLKDDAAKKILEDENIKKRVYDGKAIEVSLSKLGIDIKGISGDILLSSYLLDSTSGEKQERSYSAYGVDVSSSESSDLFNVGFPEKTGKSAYFALILKEKEEKSLQNVDAYSLYKDIELPLSRVLAKMEKRGFPCHKEILEEIGKGFANKRDEIEKEIHQKAGYEFNIGSPKQVAEFLYAKRGLNGGKIGSTSVEVLTDLSKIDPIAGDILRWRKYAKLVSTYVDGLIPHIGKDNKIHTCFNQALTTTGRLSSSSPNLQNISTRDEESKSIRKAFYYDEDDAYILSLDYSQIELRILADLSKCSSYAALFAEGQDVHSQTARAIFGISQNEEVPHSLRRKAKAVNFAIIYGTTVYGLSEQIGCSPKEASEIISAFYQTYPEIQEYLNSIIKEVERKGYVSTKFGRRRYLRDITDPNYAKREAAKRQALNAPIQGSAADLIKIAMLKVDEFLEKGGYKTEMVLQIHDELLFRIPKDEIEIVMPKIKEIMEGCVKLSVPLQVEGNVAKSWFEAKE